MTVSPPASRASLLALAMALVAAVPANGKIVTDLVGTPIEIAVYELGDKYFAARSNEFGYANYEIIPAVAELSPLAAAPRSAP
jgi:hypothetical protein